MATHQRYLASVAVAWAVLGLVIGCGFADPLTQTAPATAVMDSAGVLSNRLSR